MSHASPQELDFVAQAEPLIRNISDTALLAAVYRARETERPDALFHDRFARRLAGKRGDQIADSIAFSNRNTWAWVTRTYLFGQYMFLRPFASPPHSCVHSFLVC